MAAGPDPKLQDIWLDRILRWWATVIIRFRWLWILSSLLLGGASLYYTMGNLGVDMDSTKLLSAELPFQKDRERLQRLFPYDLRCILVVVESPTPEQTHAAAKSLGELLAKETTHVRSVYLPGQGDFFDRQSLLFLEPSQLEKVATDISRAQPFIGRLARNNSLSEFLALVGETLSGGNDRSSLELDPLLGRMTIALQNLLQGKPQRISWQEMMLEDASQLNKRTQLIRVKPVFHYDRFVPAAPSVEAVRRISRDFENSNPAITVRLTGEVALEHEELASVSKGITIAAISSALLVGMCLIIGLRSAKLVVATLITLLVGLLLSAGFATWSVGHLNVISVSFAVLYLGLGVDYAIHFCLHFREMVGHKQSWQRTIAGTLRDVGPSIILCTITTAISFYVFIPTPYKGVAELGIIAGTAMFISCFVTLTLLPAILALMRVKSPLLKEKTPRLPQWVYSFPMRRATMIRTASLLLTIGGSILLLDVRFDFSPINLRDPNTESVVVFKKLLREKNSPLMTISVLAENLAETRKKASNLNALAVVDNTISIESFIPGNQEDKLAIIDDLAMVLGPELGAFPYPAEIGDPSESVNALKSLANIIETRLAVEQPTRRRETLEQLGVQIHFLLSAMEMDPLREKAMIEQFQDSLLANLPPTLHRLATALEAEPIEGFEDLPVDLAKRWVSPNGIFRIEVYPSKDLNELENQREFVSMVKKIEPHATGLPVQYLESGREVVRAFQHAFLNAGIAIIVITFLVLRSLRETLLILYLLGLVSVLTGAASVVFNIPFNFANITALPLLMGLGVDSAIHLIHRLRTEPDRQWDLLRTSAAEGVLFSTLTTLFSFVSLAVVAHAGTASLGRLLTIGIVSTLLCMLVVLPAFAVRNRMPQRKS